MIVKTTSICDNKREIKSILQKCLVICIIQREIGKGREMSMFKSLQLTIKGNRPSERSQPPTEDSLQPQCYEKFVKFLNKKKERSLVQGINNYYGKNFPIDYQKKYKFNQKWQEKMTQYAGEQFLLEEPSGFYSSFSIFMLLINVFTLWALTTQRYYQTNIVSLNTSYYSIQIAVNILEIFIKCILLYRNEDGNNFTFKKVIKITSKDIICFVYFLYLQIEGPEHHPLQYIVEIVIYYLLWKNASETFKNFKLKSFALKYQNQLKIFQLLLNILIQAHIFSIMMICASRIDHDKNWIKAKGIEDLSIFQKYIYSFYFSCTTMLTIGYGDITPQTSNQMLVIIVIEIIGVVSFGYLLNEMGHTLSKMRQETQILEKDLQTIGKMARYYHLEKILQNRAKKYIITNGKVVDQLRPDDQNRLLMKLNDQLRTQITNQNLLGIVKTSIFFLCHWSKGFQSCIARSLQKRLFSPNERLGQTSKIYIIRSGKINIYLNRFGSINHQGKKLLRIISVSNKQTVSDNIYGYTFMFSNRPVFLQAIAKQFTTTYSLPKQEFLRCMQLDHREFEYFHQIKCRIDQSAFCQEWQAPAIKNIREHYIPSRIFLIKKYRAKITRQINQRQNCLRRRKIKNRLINELVISNADNISPFNSAYTLGEKTLQFRSIDKAIQLSLQSQSSSQSFSKSSFSQNDSIENKSIEMARQYIKTFKFATALEQNENKKIISYIFEKRQDFTNFFPNNNFNKVLQKLQKQNFFERTLN